MNAHINFAPKLKDTNLSSTFLLNVFPVRKFSASHLSPLKEFDQKGHP